MLLEVLPLLNLQLFDERDSSVFSIKDNSTYSILPTSGQIIMQITPPGYPTLNVPFTPSSVNTYKCVDLGITCSDSGCTPLPDGIYAINYTVVYANSANTTTNASIDAKFIKIDKAKCLYEHAFLKLNVEYSCHNHTTDPYHQTLKMVKLYLDGCVAACNASNYVLSNDLYSKAVFLLNHLNCEFKSTNFRSHCNTGIGYGGSLIGCNCK